MQIKEAAARASLTERAIRLYEERGLIRPSTTRKNGRDFRDYSEEDVECLETIAALRRARFTLDEIGSMFDDPSTIADTIGAHRERMRKEEFQLSYILSRIGSVDVSTVADANALACAIFAPIPKKDASGDEKSAAVADPDDAERRRAYEKYLAENTVWEEKYEKSLRASRFTDALKRFLTRKAVVVCIAAVVLLIASLIPRVETVSLDYSGAVISNGKNDGEAAVTVHGRYLRYIFGETKFEGYIETDVLRNASAPDSTGRFSFVCRFIPDGGVDKSGVEKYFFDLKGADAVRGVFDGEDMASLVLLIGTDGQPLRAIVLSRGGSVGAGTELFDLVSTDARGG